MEKTVAQPVKKLSAFCGTQTLQLDPILSLIKPVQAHLTYFFKFHFNISLSFMPNLSSGLFPSGFLTKIHASL
jgi:hypothetical protein